VERIWRRAGNEHTLIGKAIGAVLTGIRSIAEIMYIDYLDAPIKRVGNLEVLMPYCAVLEKVSS